MNLLLDTHSLLWSLFDPSKLSAKARRAITDPANDVMVSVVTFWEISLKYGLGKLDLENTTPEDLPNEARSSGFELITLAPDEAAGFHRLPRVIHRDPFDRMLVWQAIRRRWTLVSKDKDLGAYRDAGLEVYW